VTRSEHGMIALPPVASSELERAYAIHRTTALIARGSFNTDLARHHAAKTRQLVREYAKYPPFSRDAGIRYLGGAR
jgi:hypothetical protein